MYWMGNHLMLIIGIAIIATLLFMLVASIYNGKKQASLERKMEDSQKLYRVAANSANLVVWEYDPSTHVIAMSFDSDFTKYVCGVRGFPQILEEGPKKQAAVIFEKDRPALLGMYQRIDAGADTAECRYGFLWDGIPSYRHARATAIYDDKTHRRTAVCISVDITAEVRMQGLYEKELQYLHQTNDGALTSKGHFDLTDNTALEYAMLIEAGPRPIDSRDYDKLLHSFLETIEEGRDREAIARIADRQALIQKYREGERHFSYRYRRAKRGQPPAWVELQCNIFTSPVSGHIECFMYSYDVTEQELKNQIVSKQVDLGYENMGFIYPDTCAVTAFLLDEPGVGEKRISAMDYDAMLGYVLSKSGSHEDQESLLNALCMENILKNLASEMTYTYPFSIEMEGRGAFRKQFAFSWLDDRYSTIFFCLSDITIQYETTQRQIRELDEARAAALRANEAKSRFLSSMSHDLRTPLNGILGFTALALDESDSEKMRDYLKKIKLSGNLLLDLVNDTLDLSRIESGKMKLEPEEIDGPSFLESVITAVEPVAEEKGIHLVVDAKCASNEVVYADRLKLQKVVLNLLSNAIKYTPKGGTVRFAADNAVSSGNRAMKRIIIEDNGIGIHEEFLERLYDPFTQESRPEAVGVQGTGLGLSIVKRIVDLMDGTIDVRSEVGKGTRFVVELPLPCREKSARSEAIPQCAAVTFSGKSVLVFEDNCLNAEIVTTILEGMGASVTLAENGKLGVDCFCDSPQGAFDAILMDIRMPMMDGYEATSRIRSSAHPDAKTVPIIAMTADAFEEDIRRVKEAGMDDFLAKPIDPGRLTLAVSRAIAKNA